MTDYILNVKTVNANVIKYVFELLSRILTEANVIFEQNAMRIFTMDQSKCILIQLRLDAKKFETYECERTIVCGLNLSNFSQYLKPIENGHVLQFYMLESNPCQLGINIENEEESLMLKNTINLLEIEEDSKLKLPSVSFNTIIEMRSSKFQKIITYLAVHDTKNIEILKVNRTLCFKCTNSVGTREVILGEAEGNIQFETDNQTEIIQGLFSAKMLASFTKATNLHNTVQLYIKNNFPLIIQYLVSDLGFLKLGLVQARQDTN